MNNPRYVKENEYYITDKYTGQKLSFDKMIGRLNTYEELIQGVKNK